ncbi:hypothetical protein I6J71_10255 [Amycolatopsis sp. FDAARGOS 1241]|nr:hypothetical protein I6J71_10255 [Amycolatopsis sp. FDAARGOS 1241]
MGALAYLDRLLGTNHAAEFLGPDGPWLHWAQERVPWLLGPDGERGLLFDQYENIAAQCAFADECLALVEQPPTE